MDSDGCEGCGCLLNIFIIFMDIGLSITGKKPKSRSQRQQDELADLRLRVAEMEVELRKNKDTE